MESTDVNEKQGHDALIVEPHVESVVHLEAPAIEIEADLPAVAEIAGSSDEEIILPSPEQAPRTHRLLVAVQPADVSHEALLPPLPPAARSEASLNPVKLGEDQLTRELELSPQRYVFEKDQERPSGRLCTRINFDVPLHTQNPSQALESQKTQNDAKSQPFSLLFSPNKNAQNSSESQRDSLVSSQSGVIEGNTTPTSWRTGSIANNTVAPPDWTKCHDLTLKEKAGHTSTPNQSHVDELHLTDSDIAHTASRETTPNSQGQTEPLAVVDEAKYWKLTIECNFGKEVNPNRIVRVLPKFSGVLHYVFSSGEKKFVEDIPTESSIATSSSCSFTTVNSTGYLADTSGSSKQSSRLSRGSVASSIAAGMFPGSHSSRMSIASAASVDFPKPSHPVRPRPGPKSTSSPEVITLEDNPGPENTTPVDSELKKQEPEPEVMELVAEKPEEKKASTPTEEPMTSIVSKDKPNARKRGRRLRQLSGVSETTTNSDDDFVLDKKNRKGSPKASPSKNPKKRAKSLSLEAESQAQGASTSKIQRKKRLTEPKISEETLSDVSARENIKESAEDLLKQAELQWNELRSKTLEQGMDVYARWPNGYYYPATLQTRESDGRWLVEYADERLRKIPEHQILPIGLLRVGQAVCVDSENKDTESLCRPGCILSYKRVGDQIAYLVDCEGSDAVVCERRNVFFTSDQAKEMEAMNVVKAVFTPYGANVSLDNIVEGKRRRGTCDRPASSPGVPVSSPRTPRPSVGKRIRGKHDQLLDTSTMSESSESVLSGLEASLRQRVVARFTGQVEKEDEEASATVGDPAETELLGPLPETSLFVEYAFLLTRTCKILSTEGEEECEYDSIPYVKSHLAEQLSQGGGLVLERFNYSQISSRPITLLVANRPCRTERYIRCLAVGIRAVSHQWVVHCCQQGKLLPWQSYTLSAGLALDGSELSWDHRGNSSVFKGMRILVTSQSPGFLDLWQPLLLDAQASVVKRLPARKKSNGVASGALCVDVVVSDQQCSAAVLRTVSEAEIPIVSTEWVIQCLISGKRLGFQDSPHYAYDYGKVP